MSAGSSQPKRTATWNPARGVWETSEIALCGHSEPFSETFPSSGMTRAGVAFELPTPELPTLGTGCSSQPGLLPTPAASNPNDGESVESWTARRDREKAKGRNGNGIGTPLGVAVQMLPTPTASDRHGPGQHGQGGADLRTTVSTLMPTPTARDWKAAGDSRERTQGQPLNEVAALLPTPTAAATPKSRRALTKSTENGRRSGGGQSSSLGLDEVTTLLAGELPANLPPVEELPDRTREQVTALLPTPRATDGEKGGPNQRGSSGDMMLPSAVSSLGATTDPRSDAGN